MRSHPLDNVREPKVRAALTAGLVGLVALSGAGLALHLRNEAARLENVRRAVAAEGYGRAEVEAIAGDECWRGRDGFRWRTQTASGSACAGPGSEVRLYRTERPRL